MTEGIDGLAAEVLAAGRLLGLLDGSSVDPSFFADPAAALRTVPRRVDQLSVLLGAVLGGPALAPAVPGGSGDWYPLPDGGLGLPSAIHLVVPGPTAAGGAFGVGLLETTKRVRRPSKRTCTSRWPAWMARSCSLQRTRVPAMSGCR